ncbi:MAG: ATP-dependent helicase HrpB [Thermodesulfovibrionales bacterium]
MTSYPIDALLPRLKEAVRRHAAVVLHAPPGAGKTTRVPLALLDILPPEKGRIMMLEPRRIAAVSAARWMARTLGEEVGETVGYSIRFDAKTTERTRVEVVTEGILTRRIQADPGLDGIAVVIFDEFHERSLHADLALALCLDLRGSLREDLKILVMSATLECGPVADLLGGAPVITAEGRAFPVEERYLSDRRERPLPERTADAVRTALRETQGDILVFLPGSGEIRSSSEALRPVAEHGGAGITLHPLYGDLPFEEQERALLPSRTRKIVLATNIAETSLTIEGVRCVIDSGLTRRLRYDPATGMNRLLTAAVSRASAEQRKGRAGRLGPGVCYRLYSRHAFHSLIPYTPPEMLVSDLTSLVLELAVWGVRDPAALSWLDAPPAAAWEASRRLLMDLGALDPAGSATPDGAKMARLPLPPRLARLLLRAAALGAPRLGADLAALLSERDLLRRTATERGRAAGDPDIQERLLLLHAGRRQKEASGGADPWALRAVERTAGQLLRLLPKAGKRPGGGAAEKGADTPELASRLLLSAFPERVAIRREEGEGRFLLVQGRGVRVSPASTMSRSPFLVAAALDAGEGAEGVVHIAAPLTEEVIRRECAGRIETLRRVAWNKEEGRIAAALEERLGAVPLSVKPFSPSDAEAVPLLCEAVRANPVLLSFSREARQFLGRVALLRRAFPEEAWPDLSEGRLLGSPEEWLAPWLGGIRTGRDLAGLELLPALTAQLSWAQLRLLDERAPSSLAVPSGHRVALDYTAGELPVLAVKLQEMFGLADTPSVAGGRLKVLLHLLSPARRPVQITQDLKGFWNGSYHQVKKELKGRYPKHPWPDDPWNAAPTRRTKPSGR